MRWGAPTFVLIGLAASCWTCSADGKQKSTDAAQQQAAVLGRTLFIANCAACHGAQAQGGDGPDLRRQGLTSTFIASRVKNGMVNEMPAFTKFSDSQLSAVVTYVRSLQ